jgi:cell division protein FtsI/penicillin-binding protein 2
MSTGSSTRTRIGVLAGFLFAGGAIVLLHLWSVMVDDHAVWARRSHENRWSFRSVPSVRGSIRDRLGNVLVYDEPTMEISLYYQRFRLRHPIGAAVHGATLWAQQEPARVGTTYSYRDGVLGPAVAARDLLAMPAAALRPGVFPKDVSAELATLATTVLSACSGLPRKRVFAAMRAVAQQGGETAIGDTMPGTTREELLATYDSLLRGLHSFEDELLAGRRDRALRLGQHDSGEPILFAELERLREASLLQIRVPRLDSEGQQRRDKDGKLQWGDLVESISWPFADHVPFELAASLRVGARRHPGLDVNPSVQRICNEVAGSSLAALLGRVFDVDKISKPKAWIASFLATQMPKGWVEELVPEEAAANDLERGLMQSEAKQSFARALLLQSRSGISGVEAGFDDQLSGRIGMRLVERDAKAREQQLWSHLRVESGEDVTLTIDVGLQRLAEAVVQRRQAEVAARHADAADAALVEASLAVIDAQTGDVLAFAGAPIKGNSARSVPGITWSGNFSLGSVVKPFVLIEQLQAQALGRPHREIEAFVPCERRYLYNGHAIFCDGVHGRDGCDPVKALAKSCNIFFYQCAEGLELEGVQRAMRRFGLLAPEGPNDAFAACWQDSVRGLPAVRPRWRDRFELPKRAIGYGVHASPVDVARAYAGLATGRLPTLGVVHGVQRPGVPLVGLDGELEVVREGLRECVQSGTASKINALVELGVFGKTGTAEVGQRDHENNAWFAGYLPWAGADGVQLCFCGVVYWAPNLMHGGEVAGEMVGQWLSAVQADANLAARYLTPGGGR